MAQSTSSPANILSDLSKASSGTRRNARTQGRFVRTPKYEAPAAKSTRPQSDKGVTFHFAHKAISKRNDISESNENATSASAHQTYIERKEAGAELSEKEKDLIQNDDSYQSKNIEDFDEEVTTSEQCSDSIKKGFSIPNITVAADRMGFGTIGETPADRKRFWQKVETNERRHGRVQSRIIAELPYEVSNIERTTIAKEFCKELHQKGLPFWAAIHAPTKKNDKRNYHLHIAYYDRPAMVSDEGTWNFEVKEKVKLKNRSTKTIRPLLQRKPDSIRDRGWVKNLRKKFEQSSNKVLEEGGYEKRLDSRSYKESGVRKDPTKHLGFKANAMEKFGLETEVGQANARKEMTWKVQERSKRWDTAIAQEEVIGLFSDEELDADFFEANEGKLSKLRKGRTHAIKSAQASLLSDQLTMRIDKRKVFVEEESYRLLTRGRGLLIGETLQDVMVLNAESEIIQTRQEEIFEMSKGLSMLSEKESENENKIWAEIYPEDRKDFSDGLDVFGTEIIEVSDFENWTSENSIPAAILSLQTTSEQNDDIFSTGMDDDINAMFSEQNYDAKEKKDPSVKQEDTPTDTTNIVAEEGKEQSKETTSINQINVDGWALLVDRPTSKEDIKELDNKLQNMTNKNVRMIAIGTRDLVDFFEDGPKRDAANRGWIVLRHEATRRGLDLESGKQNLAKATDKERAELHRDEYLQSVLEVRQEVIKTQSR